MTAEERREQEYFFKSMKYEIETMRVKVEEGKKLSTIRDLKIFGSFLRLVSPYLITAGISTGIMLSLYNPFTRNYHKAYSHSTTEYDPFGTRTRQELYYGENTATSRNLVKYYTGWTYDQEGYYIRSVTTYEVPSGKTLQEVLDFLQQNQGDMKDSPFKKISTIQEKKFVLTEEELKQEASFEVVFYTVDRDDYILTPETDGEHLVYSLGCVLVVIICQLLPVWYRTEFPYDHESKKQKIEEQYKDRCGNINVLRKRLEIREENYRRLMED